MWIQQIMIGIGAGATYSLSQFTKKKNQDFDFNKFFSTLTVGAISGAITELVGLDIQSTYLFVIQLGIVPIIENAYKSIWRHALKPWLDTDNIVIKKRK